jgi:3-dehydroquinate dehydratase/shikimate dehydrogenase
VPRGELRTFLQQYDSVPVRGYSVTIPHKEAALAFAKHKEETAIRVGAANTLVRDANGFSAFNTDYQAARASLSANLAPNVPEGQPPWHEQRVLLLGAGGVARAIAHLLHREGAQVTVSNRTAERARDLAGDVGCKFIGWETRHTVACDLLINCTPVGMQPNVDESPIHPSFLTPEMKVFDTIYMPETTMLVKDARARGCKVLTGVDMFVRQAEMQFRLFTNREPPQDLMRSVVKRALSPVSLQEDEN